MSKPNDQCNRCGIDRDVHDLAPSIGHAFVEPARAEGEGELDPILHPAGHTPAVIACPCGWRRDAAAAPQAKSACTCKNVPLTAGSGGISAPQPGCPEHWPDPDAAVRPLLKEGAKKWREAWENDTNETIDEFFLRMTTEVFFEGTSSTRAEAFAAGRALGRDEGAREEREAIRKLVAGFDEDVDFDGQELLDDINIEIARRGSVPK